MKLGRYIMAVTLLALFILFAIANDEIVRINFPRVPNLSIRKSIYLPVYLLTLSVLFIGIMIGILVEYFRNIAVFDYFKLDSPKFDPPIVFKKIPVFIQRQKLILGSR